ncbi:hypothetical protein [Clostridium porci]|uniref:Uncharacterized protein n=1 Tax=Clostridium porci TaxID=2605778 RepID=A0A7X2NJE7_9CLOT|nr:hypothetical protein [Clostridium porci]MSS35969.1 hypothetical protein [Clostridium porci]
MSLNKVMDKQMEYEKWILRNLIHSKIFQYSYNSRYIVRYIKHYFPDITHEEFIHAMARCGFYADIIGVDVAVFIMPGSAAIVKAGE